MRACCLTVNVSIEGVGGARFALDFRPRPRFSLRMAKLIIGNTAHELLEPTITVGRSPNNLICVDDASVSSRHAQLQLVGESYHLKDLDSTNGTRVNGSSITTVPLRAGDRVRFGGVEAKFEAETSGEAQPLPAAEPLLARPAEESERPADFANASPFGHREHQRDKTRTGLLAAGAVAILAFVISMVIVLTMHGPAL